MPLYSRRKRRPHGAKFKVHKAPWVDPFPMIEGTEPEKRVFASLVLQLNAYFIFQGQVPEFEKGSPLYFLAPPNYKPDFVLPEYRLIIDPFSPFHHSTLEQAPKDAQKVARYEAAGYAYYHPWAIAPGVWSWDQSHHIVESPGNARLRRKFKVRPNKYGNINREIHGRAMGTLDMLRSIPELNMGPRHPLTLQEDKKAKISPGYRIGQFLGAGANSVAAANRKRAKPKSLGFKAGIRRTIRRAR